MTKRICFALVAAAGLFAASAQAQTPSKSTDCLRLGQVWGFSAVKGNDRSFVVTDRANRRFRVNLTHRCGGIDFNLAVGFKTLETGPLACISRGDTVISHDPGVAGDMCPISSVERYTPAMEAADKAAAAAQNGR